MYCQLQQNIQYMQYEYATMYEHRYVNIYMLITTKYSILNMQQYVIINIC